MNSSTKTETAAIKTRQCHRATIGCQQPSQTMCRPLPQRPAFALLHRFINCLMAEASDRTE